MDGQGVPPDDEKDSTPLRSVELPPKATPTPHRPESKLQQKLRKLGPIGVALATLLGKAKSFLYVGYTALKFLKFGKILLTFSTMLLSIWFYSTIFGLKFAVGFVILILVHEMGHVFVAWRQGLPITAPVFLPGMGAVIFNKRGSSTAWGQAIMGIGGPVAGAIGCIACVGIFGITGNPFFLALAYIGFFMNLFNLLPIVPLDGGWIVGAISPWLWLVGLIGLIGMTVTGMMSNAFVWIIVILSLPRVFSLFKRGQGQVAGFLAPPTSAQRVAMGLYYFSLAAFLAVSMSLSVAVLQTTVHPIDR